jgi:murein DD-endopeptidase MepM/ murein hydrolase activator NlpD
VRLRKSGLGLYVTSVSLYALIQLLNEIGRPSTDASSSEFPGNNRCCRRAGGGLRIDIAAPFGTPVLVAADGTILKLFHSERGGTTIIN